MKAFFFLTALLGSVSFAHAGGTRYVPDPPRFHAFSAAADEAADSDPARKSMLEGRSVHEDSDLDEAHANGIKD